MLVTVTTPLAYVLFLLLSAQLETQVHKGIGEGAKKKTRRQRRVVEERRLTDLTGEEDINWVWKLKGPGAVADTPSGEFLVPDMVKGAEGETRKVRMVEGD